MVYRTCSQCDSGKMAAEASLSMSILPFVSPGRHATCPLCHTVDPVMTEDALAAGGYWQCTICAQSWTATRLAVAAAYAEWNMARQPR